VTLTLGSPGLGLFMIFFAGHLPYCEEILSSTRPYSLVTPTNISLEAQQPSDPIE
jgi:hypothetical protein